MGYKNTTFGYQFSLFPDKRKGRYAQSPDLGYPTMIFARKTRACLAFCDENDYNECIEIESFDERLMNNERNQEESPRESTCQAKRDSEQEGSHVDWRKLRGSRSDYGRSVDRQSVTLI